MQDRYPHRKPVGHTAPLSQEESTELFETTVFDAATTDLKPFVLEALAPEKTTDIKKKITDFLEQLK